MSKIRPREFTAPSRTGRRAGDSIARWGRRVYRNSYTYRGRRVRLRHWSVKIQFRRVRRTFSLAARTRAGAALEARTLYRRIVGRGWDRARPYFPRADADGGAGAGPDALSPARSDVRYWRRRLVRRRPPHPGETGSAAGFSARIEHDGASYFFPLGTADEDDAATRAREIYLAAVAEGWAAVQARYPRELTVGLCWTERPLAWTYATIHTRTRTVPAAPDADGEGRGGALRVAIVEPDPGVRRALAECVDRQAGFACVAEYGGARESLAALPRRPPHLVLVNAGASDVTAAEFTSRLSRMVPPLPALFFTVHEDSDELFKATPGGASGYLLKRTAPDRLFEPVLGALKDGALSPDRIALHVRGYFQTVVESLSPWQPSRGVAKLTRREHDILSLLSKGYLDKEIADALGISLWTVHGHLKKIYEKLGVHTRTEAAVRYLQK